MKLQIVWDHLFPYAFSQDNGVENFVASCQICNAYKGAIMFQTIEEARTYIATQWELDEDRLPSGDALAGEPSDCGE